MRHRWTPGDVAVATVRGAPNQRVFRWVDVYGHHRWDSADLVDGQCTHLDEQVTNARPLVVIDPEDRGQVDRLAAIICSRFGTKSDSLYADGIQDALRGFADTESEPTDAKVRVTDRRDNIWRLLADGDWVCTSGPDIGEYLEWSRLAAERGPLVVDL